MKHDPLNKTLTFRTGKDLVNLLDSKKKHSPKLNVSPASNEAESALYAIWKSILGHDNFGVKDEFFGIGGNSLKAVQLLSRISKEFSVQVQLTYVFLHPTIEQLAAHIQAQTKNLLPSSIIKIDPRPEHIPLSFSQERLWFIDQLEGSVQYHTPDVLRLKGEVNKKALTFAFQEIINRHEALRTVIIENQGKPYQYVKEKDFWQLSLIDGVRYQQDFKGLQQYIDDLIKHPFDLAKDYMIRAHLVKLDEQDHVLIATMHHIASDGWSMPIFIKELVTLYEAYTENRPTLLEPLKVQYTDYALWQRQYLQGELLDKKITYWKKKLDGVEPLQLPTDYSRPAVQSTNGALISVTVDKNLSGQLQQFSQQQGATLYMTLLAAFNVLLYRYSGQTDICVGTPIAGRQQQEIEDLIGFFVNTLALRSEVSGDASFTDLLQQVRITTLEAYEHQDTPFEKIVSAVVKERDLSRSPLFQVLFVLQNTPEVPQLSLGKLTFKREEYTHDTSKFDLSFFITEAVNGLKIAVEYSTDLYTKETIERMTGHFIELLSSIIKQPGQKVGTFSMLTGAEEQLLTSFNNTSMAYPKEKTIVTLFEEQVEKTPDAIAVVFEQEHLTYSQLNNQANQLAHYLKSKGVTAETLVPICINRSVDMIAGIIGILKAGGVYVPIDPEYPQDRIAYMLDDTKAGIIVSSTETALQMPIGESVDIIQIDRDRHLLYKQPVENLDTGFAPDNTVYIIYTSGSTGKPKGVKMPGSGLVNLLTWQQKQFENKGGRVLQFASLNFDVSFQDIFSTLCFGSALYLIKADRRIDMAEIVNDIQEHAISRIFIPFIVLKNLAEYILPLYSPSFPLREIIVAGEQLKLTDDIQTLLKRSSIRLINQYGPTEAHVVSSYTINANAPLPFLPPIGKPIDNTRLYILSNEDQLTPVGVAGELHIGGVQVASGYLHLPELTAEKFIEDYFSEKEGTRLYKTGDLARWLPDGNIEYLGRKDDQIKIRGYRIELGEIESVLQECAMVRQGVVLATEDSTGNKQLVGYVVPNETFNREAIVSYLEEKLPKYMVPALWVELEYLPITTNGKINRKALPAPDTSALLRSEYIAPSNELEAALSKIWQEVLNIERVGINNNFFGLGGHSLLAMRVVSAIRRQLQVELAIKDLFLHSTISTLAGHLQNNSKALQLPAINVQVRPSRIPLSFSQERLWFIHELDGSLQYHMPLVFRLEGPVNEKAIHFALQNIINRHEVLRTVILHHEGEPYQYITEENRWQLSISDGTQYNNDYHGLKNHIAVLIDQPFDLSKSSMLRGHLIRLEEQKYMLVITMHHIASDGWSFAVLVNELWTFYKSYTENRVVQLQPLKLQYADYALWQRHYLQGELLHKKINYWKEKLQGVEPLQLPTDYQRPAVQSTKGAIISFHIDKEVTDCLQQLSHNQGATLFMTLLTAFKVLLYRYTGQDDICVGSAIADRQQQEIEHLIGFFVNTLALRSEVSGDASFIDLLHQVRITTLEAYEHQEVPFEKVVEVVVKERDMSRNPIFQVMFVWQNTPSVPAVDLEEVLLFQEPVALTKTKFDITFTVTETALGLEGIIEYGTDLYTEQTIERMAGHFKKLLSSVISEPDQKIGALSILTPSEENQLSVAFNNTTATYPKDKTVVDLFKEQVIKSPDNIAVVFEQEQLTYRQLQERSNQLAHYLRSKGVGEETLVPICMKRSPAMIIGMMGILKAGGAYVPIDSDYPEERTGYMLEDTKAVVVISSKESKVKIPHTQDRHIIDLDEDWFSISQQPSSDVENVVVPHQLAYVIYTSGSTGKPKGVMIEHRSLTNLIIWHNQEYKVSELSKATSMAGVGFDAFGWELWPYFAAGASILIVDDNTRLNPCNLLELVTANTISHSFISTALVPEFINISRHKKNPLQFLLTGGDKLSSLETKGIGYKIINNYGPTECTVVTSNYELSEKNHNITPPIGKPIANTVINIVDHKQNLVPIGVPGDIYIGGDGLARGYLNLDALTAEKFVTIPFGYKQGKRMYKSGDLGRWLPDGNIEYLGRKDDQVKVRGYRIEPGEIESVLLQSGLAKQAIVLVNEEGNSSKQLVGYIVAVGTFDQEAMVSYLKSKLPQYMVPALWVELESLPITANGKINKKALPHPDAGTLLHHKYVAPQTKVEESLAGIWKELLHLERIGIYDNFFELGGHSLLIMRMSSHIERTLSVSVPIYVLFQFTTINELGKYLELELKKVYPEEKSTTGYKLVNI